MPNIFSLSKHTAIRKIFIPVSMCIPALWLFNYTYANRLSPHRLPGDSKSTDSQNQLKVSSNILSQTFCSSSNLRLTIRLTLTNVGEQPLIIDRKYFAVYRTVVSRDSESAKKGLHELDVSSMVDLQLIKLDDSSPDNTLFVTLKAGDSYSVEIEDYIPIKDDIKAHNNYLKPGNYVLQNIILTWGGSSKLGEVLKEKWKHFGSLWLEPLITEPMHFSVDPSHLIGDCNED